MYFIACSETISPSSFICLYIFELLDAGFYTQIQEFLTRKNCLDGKELQECVEAIRLAGFMPKHFYPKDDQDLSESSLRSSLDMCDNLLPHGRISRDELPNMDASLSLCPRD